MAVEGALDQVFISGLETYCIVGVNPWEREVQQKVRLDIVMECDTRPAAASDDMALAVDYRAVAKAVLEMVTNSRFFLVEALAEAVAGEILKLQPRVEAVTVTVAKPGAVRFAESVGVRIHRRRDSGQ